MKERARKHRKLLERGTHPNRIMQNAFNKYGLSSFSISVVETIKDKTLLTEREFYWAEHFNVFDKRFGFNLCSIVENQWSSLETHSKNKRIQDGKGEKNANAKLTEAQVKSICQKLNEQFEGADIFYDDIAKPLGVVANTISAIKTGVRWGNVSVKYLNPLICASWNDSCKKKWGVSTDFKYEKPPSKRSLLRNKPPANKDEVNKRRAAALMGEKNPNVKLTEEDIKYICRKLNEQFEGADIVYSDIANPFGVTRSTIASIKTGVLWGNVSVKYLNPLICESWRDSYKKKWFPKEGTKHVLEPLTLHNLLKRNSHTKKPQIFNLGFFILHSSCHIRT